MYAISEIPLCVEWWLTCCSSGPVRPYLTGADCSRLAPQPFMSAEDSLWQQAPFRCCPQQQHQQLLLLCLRCCSSLVASPFPLHHRPAPEQTAPKKWTRNTLGQSLFSTLVCPFLAVVVVVVVVATCYLCCSRFLLLVVVPMEADLDWPRWWVHSQAHMDRDKTEGGQLVGEGGACCTDPPYRLPGA